MFDICKRFDDTSCDHRHVTFFEACQDKLVNYSFRITTEDFFLMHKFFVAVGFQAFFKFVPLKFGLPAVAFVVLIVQARAKLIARESKTFISDKHIEIFFILHNFKIVVSGRSTDEHVDKTIVKDLVSDEDALLAKSEAKAVKKQRKVEQKLRERIKAEKKKTASSIKETGEDDDEGELIAKFAKGSRKIK
jgi:hypothetical protein